MKPFSIKSIDEEKSEILFLLQELGVRGQAGRDMFDCHWHRPYLDVKDNKAIQGKYPDHPLVDVETLREMVKRSNIEKGKDIYDIRKDGGGDKIQEKYQVGDIVRVKYTLTRFGHEVDEICKIEECGADGLYRVRTFSGESTLINASGEMVKVVLAGIKDIHSKVNLPRSDRALRENKKMSIKTQANKLYSYVKPYEKYLLAAAVLIVIDHFILKGALQDRIKTIAGGVADRLLALLDRAINAITLGDKE